MPGFLFKQKRATGSLAPTSQRSGDPWTREVTVVSWGGGGCSPEQPTYGLGDQAWLSQAIELVTPGSAPEAVQSGNVFHQKMPNA